MSDQNSNVNTHDNSTATNDQNSDNNALDATIENHIIHGTIENCMIYHENFFMNYWENHHDEMQQAMDKRCD